MNKLSLMQRRIASATVFIVFNGSVTRAALQRRIKDLPAADRAQVIDLIERFSEIETRRVSKKGAATTFITMTHTSALEAVRAAGDLHHE